MPRVVQRGVHRTVDTVWPDVRYEALSLGYGLLMKRVPVERGRRPHPCRNPFGWLRALILYTLFPYDRSIWRQLRNPLWWLFKLIAVVPVYGISQVWFALLMLLHDKRDEYQLCAYVLSFKAAYFFSAGVIPAYVGIARYTACLYNEPSDRQIRTTGVTTRNVARTCLALSQDELFLLVFVAVQVLCVLIATALLPWSKKKGASKFAGGSPADVGDDGILDGDEMDSLIAQLNKSSASSEASDGRPNNRVADSNSAPLAAQNAHGLRRRKRRCCTRGGVLPKMVALDMFFLLCIGGLVATLALTGDHALSNEPYSQNVHFRAVLYWCRVLYGLLSAPFLVFLAPVVPRLLTHARPTAYNLAGDTVPFVAAVSRQADAEARQAAAAQQVP